MKKNNFFILFMILLTYSCDKSGSVLYEINNYTDYDGTVTFYNPTNKDTTYCFIAHAKVQLSQKSGLGITTYVINTEDDSVVFSFENGDHIKYYLDSMNEGTKTIYMERYWNIKEPSKNNYICTFPIYEEDLTKAY